MNNAPQIFHNKADCKTNFISYPNELFAAINNIFSRTESIVLLTWLGCKGDGSFSPNISYMLKMTGIKTAENYYRIKRDLIGTKYVEESEGGAIHINTEEIISAWQNGIAKQDRKKEREQEREKRKKPKANRNPDSGV